MPDDLDKDLIEDLFKKYEQMMCDVALGILHNRTDAEDAVQDAFLWIINNPSKIIEIPCNKRASYIATIIEHISLNLINKQRRHPTDDIDEHAELKLDYSLEETVSEKITVEEMKQAIRRMSQKDQYILQLFYFEGKSYSEISEIMRLPKNNVGTYLHRALEHLKKILEEEGFSYDL